jgi:Ca-activated chloride channel family protein
VSPALTALLALALQASPLEAEEPNVREGNEAVVAGDAAAALPRYDAAEAAVGPRAEIDFDRGNALFKAGRPSEAREAWKRALERDQAGALSSRAWQNTASALEATGNREGALRALGEALSRDPANEDARYNLEVLLRRKAEGKGAPKDPGEQGTQQPKGPQQQGAGQAQDQPKPTPDQAGQKPEPRPGDKKEEQPSPQQDQGKREGAEGRERDRKPGADAAAHEGPLGKQDAERLLDALRAREKNMPLGPAGRKEGKRKDAARDW